MPWHKAFLESELAVGKARSLELAGQKVALCHLPDGFYAIQDLCTHDGAALGQGELLDDRIECPRHGAMFHVRSGKVLSLPAVKDLRTFPVHVEGGEVFVEI